MPERREFKMSDEALEKLVAAGKPVPYIIVGGVAPSSPQENANRAWEALGFEMGFDWRTVEPVAGKDQRHFTAEPTDG